jgi:hypothetical protein
MANYNIGDRVKVKNFGWGYIYDIWQEGKYVVEVEDHTSEEGFSTQEIQISQIEDIIRHS